MASLIKSAKLAQLSLKTNPILFTAVRNHWNKDYKPGPYPQTEQERLRAAEKYGLHPSEYEPYPDDGLSYGDYPKLPDIGLDQKDPFYPYDNPELKRNFNEPLHAEFDLIREDRYNLNAPLRYSVRFQWFQFLAVMFGSYAIYKFFDNFKMFHPLVPRQYPKDGPHYTFKTE